MFPVHLPVVRDMHVCRFPIPTCRTHTQMRTHRCIRVADVRRKSVCACIHTYMQTNIHNTYTQTYMQTNIHKYMHAYIHTHRQKVMHAFMYHQRTQLNLLVSTSAVQSWTRTTLTSRCPDAGLLQYWTQARHWSVVNCALSTLQLSDMHTGTKRC